MNSGPLSSSISSGCPRVSVRRSRSCTRGVRQRDVHLAGQSLPAESVRHIESPELLPRDEPILDEVHGPPMILRWAGGRAIVGTRGIGFRRRRRTTSPSRVTAGGENAV
jgi:hypothetical protein